LIVWLIGWFICFLVTMNVLFMQTTSCMLPFPYNFAALVCGSTKSSFNPIIQKFNKRFYRCSKFPVNTHPLRHGWKKEVGCQRQFREGKLFLKENHEAIILV